MSDPEFHDVVIAGGGMTGASLARALAGSGLRVAVIEPFPPGDPGQPGFDDRALALAFGTARILNNLGCWSRLRDEVNPITSIHVSEQGHFGFTRLHADNEGVEALGYVVPARALGQALLRDIRGLDGVEWLSPARLQRFDTFRTHVALTLEHDGKARRINTALLVGADGGRSIIRERLNIPTRRTDYAQHAVVCNVQTRQPHHNIAYERFTDAGPMAMLPMTGQRSALVWSVRDDRLDELLNQSDRDFTATAERHFGQRLGRFEQAGKRSAHPLEMLRAETSTAPRVVLIGNAAHTLHPIAGQGFNLGIRDVAVLAEVLGDATRQGIDPGGEQPRGRYANWRQRDQRWVARATDSLVQIFGNPLAPIRAARGFGLTALDNLPTAKHLLARGAMGLAGHLPRLAREEPAHD